MKKYLLLIVVCGLCTSLKGQSIDTALRSQKSKSILVFPGGWDEFYKYLDKTIFYPRKYLAKKVGGKVIMTFMIERDGSLSDIKTNQSPNIEFTNECMRVVQDYKLTPATVDGKPSRIKYAIVIKFDPTHPFQHHLPDVL